MSGGTVCRCEEAIKPEAERRWTTTAYKHNRSAFNGYRRTPSDYSAVQCDACLASWRTRAPYAFRFAHRGL